MSFMKRCKKIRDIKNNFHLRILNFSRSIEESFVRSFDEHFS